MVEASHLAPPAGLGTASAVSSLAMWSWETPMRLTASMMRRMTWRGSGCSALYTMRSSTRPMNRSDGFAGRSGRGSVGYGSGIGGLGSSCSDCADGRLEG